MSTIDSVLSDALSLPPADRGQLIQRLVESLSNQDDDPTAEDAWAEVIRTRLAQLDAGTATLIDARSALAKGREDLLRRRG